MNCPACGGKPRVLRTVDGAGETRRSRECQDCGERWTTTEVCDTQMSLLRNALALVESAKSFFKEIGHGKT